MTIPEVESLCQEREIKVLALTSASIEGIKELPKIHGDPFDRILVAQARMENMVIVTRDGIIPQYPVRAIW